MEGRVGEGMWGTGEWREGRGGEGGRGSIYCSSLQMSHDIPPLSSAFIPGVFCIFVMFVVERKRLLFALSVLNDA